MLNEPNLFIIYYYLFIVLLQGRCYKISGKNPAILMHYFFRIRAWSGPT